MLDNIKAFVVANSSWIYVAIAVVLLAFVLL